MKILLQAGFFHRKSFYFLALFFSEFSLSSCLSGWSADTNKLAQGKTQPMTGGRGPATPWINVLPGNPYR